MQNECGIKVKQSENGFEEMGAAQTWGVVKVLHDFVPTSEADHITITSGDMAVVQFMGQRGWSYGRIIRSCDGQLVPDSRAGWFPSAYVAPMCDANTPQRNAEEVPMGLVTVLQSSEQGHFHGTPGTVLKFRAGEIIAVWKEGPGGWLLGSVVMSAGGTLEAAGSRGWFAADLTTRFPPPLYLRTTPDPNDEYSPFAKPAPVEFPDSPIAEGEPTSTVWESEICSHVSNSTPSDLRQHPQQVAKCTLTPIDYSTQHSQFESSELLDDANSTKFSAGKRGLGYNKQASNSPESDSDLEDFELDDSELVELDKRAAEFFPGIFEDKSMNVSRTGTRATSASIITNSSRSSSPHYWKNNSLSAIDDITVHVSITFTNDVLECGNPRANEASLRRLAASLITSICRRLAVSERRFKVSKYCGKSTILLDVLPYYVLSPSEAGIEISAAQLGRKIVTLSRSDHGWVGTMSLLSKPNDSDYGLQADVICLEMSAEEAAALREQQMNDLAASLPASPGTSVSSHKNGLCDIDGDTDGDTDCNISHIRDSKTWHQSRSSDKALFSAPEAHTSSKMSPRSFTTCHTPRIALRIVAAEHLPLVGGPALNSRPFVTLSVGDITVCTKPVARIQGDFDAQYSSSDDELPSLARSAPYHAAMWNEEFILDVPPDVIHRSKVVVELCFEGSANGEQLLAGLVEPAIGFEDLVRAREYNEWHPLVGKKHSCVYA